MNNTHVVSHLALDGLIGALQMIAANYAVPLNDLVLDRSFILDDLVAAAVGDLGRASPTAGPGLRKGKKLRRRGRAGLIKLLLGRT